MGGGRIRPPRAEQPADRRAAPGQPRGGQVHVANALAKLGTASRAELRRWDGVRRDSALKNGNAMTEVKLGPIGQIARSVSDIAASAAWYRDVLGLPHLFTFGELAFFDGGGTRLYLQQGDVKPESILYFDVSDIHATYDALVAEEVEIVAAPHLVHRHADGREEWLAFFNDPRDARSASGPS